VGDWVDEGWEIRFGKLISGGGAVSIAVVVRDGNTDILNWSRALLEL
jgi:hypothetical protein